MLISPPPPSFLDTHSLSTLFLRCKALYRFLSFLVLWSICFRSSLVHFKNGPGYLTKGTAQVFIPQMRFLLCSLVSSCFSFSWKALFLFFILSPIVCWCPLPIFLRICRFPFLRAFWFCLNYGSSIPSVLCRFPLFIISMAHFLMPNSIPISLFYILTAYIRLSNSHFWQPVWCCPCTLGGWFFLAIYVACIRLCIFKVSDWVASSLLEMIMIIVHLRGRSLPGFSP